MTAKEAKRKRQTIVGWGKGKKEKLIWRDEVDKHEDYGHAEPMMSWEIDALGGDIWKE